MGNYKAKMWIVGYFILVSCALGIAGQLTVKVDPFFHYHKPHIENYYYNLNNQRSQNDGIVKYFEYDALITGTSMSENFKTSEMDELFDTNAIKVSFSGGYYKEINDNVETALEHNPELAIIIRGLDMSAFFADQDAKREDLGEYPTYLYDDNIFNDIKYILNRDIFFNRVYPMVIENDKDGFEPGITSFDTYSSWMGVYRFGVNSVCPGEVIAPVNAEAIHLTMEERENILNTVEQNIVSLPRQYPHVTFYYFFPPYSTAWWKDKVNDGTIYKQIEAEQTIIEEILKYDNIKLYSFNTLTDITTDLNNYKDSIHYGPWINSLMLYYMKNEKCLLTKENYSDYLNLELSFYTTYDYTQLNSQIDYDNDYYAEVNLYRKTEGIEPLNMLNTYLNSLEMSQSEIVENQYEGEIGLRCAGSLLRDSDGDISIADYIASYDYVGAKFYIEDISDYRYLVYYGIKNNAQGQPSVYIYDQNNIMVAGNTIDYRDLDEQWHQYIINVSQLSGPVTIIFNGGHASHNGSKDSSYTFSNMLLY